MFTLTRFFKNNITFFPRRHFQLPNRIRTVHTSPFLRYYIIPVTDLYHLTNTTPVLRNYAIPATDLYHLSNTSNSSTSCTHAWMTFIAWSIHQPDAKVHGNCFSSTFSVHVTKLLTLDSRSVNSRSINKGRSNGFQGRWNRGEQPHSKSQKATAV